MQSLDKDNLKSLVTLSRT